MRRDIIELLKDKKTLKDNGMFIVDTEKILGEAIEAGFEVTNLLYCEQGLKVVDKYGDRVGHGVCETTKNSFIDRFANVKSHQGFIAVVKSQNREITGYDNIKSMVLLDNIQDPSNVGAIIRSGAAFGFNDYLLLNCAGIYSDKVIRASAGTVFFINYRNIDFRQLTELSKDFQVIAADVAGGDDLRRMKQKLKNKFIIALGSEGQGLSVEVKSISKELVKINYTGKVESLNVSAAAAIIFYELGGR